MRFWGLNESCPENKGTVRDTKNVKVKEGDSHNYKLFEVREVSSF